MKNIKLAMALTAAMVASSSVNATNTQQATVGVTAYIAAGLSLSIDSPLVFGALVMPVTTGEVDVSSPSSINITCENDIEYSTHGSPSGMGNLSQNASGADVTPDQGIIIITGEPEYAISVSVSAGETPEGVVFSPLVDDDCDSGAQPGNTALDDNGNLTLKLFGSLTVDETFIADKEIVTNAVVTVNYR
ncbi:hypothetical protein AB833_24370 [Chromatiales bacterium (ex Bugula neritina AB1)]|nr:hypothetical protein AB833_24370 [Chromatiales bacterium (ex Bugula neritina AB1)]